MTETKKRLVLIDAHALIHRAYHALPSFVSGRGEPTGALYGLSTMLMKVVSDLKPDYIIACFDLPKPTFRHAAFKGYKAGRPKTEDELKHQLERSRDLFRAFSVPIYDAEGFEADDILGTIAEKAAGKSEIVIASGDMDTLQLVSGKNVKVLTLKKGITDTILYDEEKVLERFGFSPAQIPDYKGLAGDPSDNIPGVRGVGEKTATILIKKFGSVEKIYKALKKNKKEATSAGISERVTNLLLENEEEALFSKTLAEIRRDAPIDFSLPKRPWREEASPDKIQAFFDEVGFGSLRERAKKMFSEETASGKSVPAGKKTKEKKLAAKKKEPEMLIPKEEKLLYKKASIALFIVDSEKISALPSDILSYTKKNSFGEALKELEGEIKKEKLDFVYEKIELPLIPVVLEMEKNGVCVDAEYLRNLGAGEHKKLSELEKEIWKLAGGNFNINSPKQLGEILFDKLLLTAKGLRKTEGGARSTNVDTLKKLKGAHPIVEKIIEHRELSKLLSTYIDTLPELVSADGRIHATFLQNGAATGRFSSVNPNLQNIPTKEGLGLKIRHAFVAPKGKSLLSADYSHVELRAAAVLSKDEKLLAVFKEGKDPHAAVASRVFGVSEKEVTPDMRRQAKVINFGILYGMGVNSLREALGGERAEAVKFYEAYKNTFSKLMEYLEETKRLARKNGYTETLFGRRRQILFARSPIPFVRAMGERMAINAPAQGTSADIIKIAMVDVAKIIEEKKWGEKVKMILQVHDELVFEVEKDIVPEVGKEIRAVMEEVVLRHKKESATIPFPVSMANGPSWDLV